MDEPGEGRQPDAKTNSSPTAASGLLKPALSGTRPLDTLFVGREGLRVGWRLLVYLALREILYFGFGYGVSYAASLRMLEIWVDLLAEAAFLLAALLPAFLMALLEGRAFGVYGLPPRRAFGKLFWVGAAWGLGAISILMFALRGSGVFAFGAVSLHGVRILKLAGFWGLFFLLVGFAEEFFLRGYTQFTLAEGIGFWPAAIALSIAFGAIHSHNPGETPVGLVAVAGIGLFFCLTLRRTGSLWFAVGFHSAWDWGESFLYSVPDSGTKIPGHLMKSLLHGPDWLTGGSAGPEGSVFLFVLVVILWVVFSRAYPPVMQSSARPAAS